MVVNYSSTSVGFEWEFAGLTVTSREADDLVFSSPAGPKQDGFISSIQSVKITRDYAKDPAVDMGGVLMLRGTTEIITAPCEVGKLSFAKGSFLNSWLLNFFTGVKSGETKASDVVGAMTKKGSKVQHDKRGWFAKSSFMHSSSQNPAPQVNIGVKLSKLAIAGSNLNNFFVKGTEGFVSDSLKEITKVCAKNIRAVFKKNKQAIPNDTTCGALTIYILSAVQIARSPLLFKCIQPDDSIDMKRWNALNYLPETEDKYVKYKNSWTALPKVDLGALWKTSGEKKLSKFCGSDEFLKGVIADIYGPARKATEEYDRWPDQKNIDTAFRAQRIAFKNQELYLCPKPVPHFTVQNENGVVFELRSQNRFNVPYMSSEVNNPTAENLFQFSTRCDFEQFQQAIENLSN